MVGAVDTSGEVGVESDFAAHLRTKARNKGVKKPRQEFSKEITRSDNCSGNSRDP
jgi:hypothetical protein